METPARKILIIKFRYIGDVLLCTPTIEAIRKHYPHARIECLVNPGTDDVLRFNPNIDGVHVVPRSGLATQLRFLWWLRSSGFDCVFDLTDGDRSAIMTAITGASRRVGFNNENRWRGRMYSQCVSARYGSMHMIEYHGQVLASMGVSNGLGNPQVFVSVEDEARAKDVLEKNKLLNSPWVMMHPGARYWFKAWPTERFAALCDRLMENGFSVVFVGGPNDQTVVDTIQAAAKFQPISLVGQTSLLDLATLMKHCLLFVGNDGGPMHMAAAMGCPVLGLFGPSDPAVWGPRGSNTKVIYKGGDCRECFHPDCFRGEESCMRQILVDEVFESVMAFLNGSS